MTIVFHVKNPTFLPNANVRDTELLPVAVFDGNDLEMAYERTNHITSEWTKTGAADMEVLNGEMHRSTSVGDIMINDEGRWLVDRVGFTRVLPEKEKAREDF